MGKPNIKQPSGVLFVSAACRRAALFWRVVMGVLPRKALLVAVLLSLSTAGSGAAEEHEWERYFYELSDFGDGSGGAWEEAYDILCDMESHPVDINAATRDDLGQLPFLTGSQIEDICEYVSRHGPLRTAGELRMIESLDDNRRHLLQHFVYMGEPPKAARPAGDGIAGRGRSELTATARVPLYERDGDRNGYLGYKYKHWLRYTFSRGDRLTFGLSASQDAGEPMFSGKNAMGYDHYSGYLQMRRAGRVETLVLGCYRASFGMGLVMNTGFSLGKAAIAGSLGRGTAMIRGAATRSSANCLQGVAATVRLSRDIALTAFASYRPHDATLNAADGTVATIVTSGYHRTPAEMEKKNNTHSLTAGMNVRLSARGFRLGATAVYIRFDRRLSPDTEALHRRYYAAGNDFANAGVDYGYTSHVFSFSGETAANRNGRLATVNSVSVNLAGNLSLVALHRFYSYRYTALHAACFSEGGSVQNENGVYVGANWNPSRKFRLSVYADHARFAWPRYQVSQPSAASDGMLTVTCSPSRRWTLAARYRLHVKQRDNEEKTALLNRTEHRARLGLTFVPARGWSSHTQADLSLTDHKSVDRGLMVSESVAFAGRSVSVSVFCAYFRTDSYDSRLYAYERGPLYSFSFPAFYGEGLRSHLMAQAGVARGVTLIAKLGVTGYLDRSTIGSGRQAVEGSSMTDVDLQARWRF